MVVEYLQLAQALRQRDEEILLRERFAPRVAAAAPGGGTSPVARTCRANDLSVGGAAALPGCGSPDLGGPGTPPAGASYRSSRPPALVTAPFGCSAGASLGSPALGGSGKLSSGGRSGEPSPLSPYAGAASGAYGGRIAAAVPTHPASLSRHAHQSPTSQSYPNLPSPSPNAGLSPHGSSHGSGLGPGSFGSGSGSGSLGAALAAASLGPGSAGGSAHYGGAGYSCDPAGVGALGGAGIGGGGSGASPLEHSPRCVSKVAPRGQHSPHAPAACLRRASSLALFLHRWGAAARKMLAYPSAGEPEQSAAAAWPGARAAASALSPGGGGVASTAEARGEIIARCRVVGEL